MHTIHSLPLTTSLTMELALKSRKAIRALDRALNLIETIPSSDATAPVVMTFQKKWAEAQVRRSISKYSALHADDLQEDYLSLVGPDISDLFLEADETFDRQRRLWDRNKSGDVSHLYVTTTSPSDFYQNIASSSPANVRVPREHPA